MKFPRNSKLLHSPFDMAPFAAVLFLLVIFLMLGALAPTSGLPLQLPVADNLPGYATKSASVYGKKDQEKSTVVGEAPTTGSPVLSVPTVLRVWVAPWEDNRNVLHDQSFLYAVADPGHWQVSHSKQKIAEQYRVLMPAAKQAQQPESKPAQPQYQLPQTQQPQAEN